MGEFPSDHARQDLREGQVITPGEIARPLTDHVRHAVSARLCEGGKACDPRRDLERFSHVWCQHDDGDRGIECPRGWRLTGKVPRAQDRVPGEANAHLLIQGAHLTLRLLEMMPIQYDQLGTVHERSGNANQYSAPAAVFRTKDGQWVTLAGSTTGPIRPDGQ